MKLILVLSLIQYFSAVYSWSIFDPFNLGTTEVTYPGIGRFTTNDFYDQKYRSTVLLPKSPESINTRFLLHTRQNQNNAQTLKQGNIAAVKQSYFNPKRPTKFIIHGFVDNQSLLQWMKKMKDQFLTADDYNIFIVDWSGGNGPEYNQATANTRVVGPVVGLFIKDLMTLGLQVSDVHIIGHSLGAHIAGYAGAFHSGSIGRLTGLDPAGPSFEGMPPAARLDPTDGVFVDVIHTNGKTQESDYTFGLYQPSGHLDFYPNGGHNQPGCDTQRWTSIITDGIVGGIFQFVACNHYRAVDYYIESINKNFNGLAYQCSDYESFLAGKCVDCGAQGEKCAYLGEKAVLSERNKIITRGQQFFLRTGKTSPYFN